jgi:hypothetical protein
MSIAGAALGLLLLAYFVWKARNKRIFLLGLPFLMYMGESVYFDKVKIFWMPQRIGASTMIMVWLVVVWVISMDLALPRGEERRTRRPFGPSLRLPEELLLAILAAFVLVNTGVSSIRYGDPASALWQASGWIYLFVGYLLIRGIVAMADTADVIEFLEAVVVINAGAAVLYIANQALHLPLYEGSISGVVVFQGQTIIRGFAFYPQMLLLTLAMVFARPRWTWTSPLILIVNIVAIWLSYTRSWLFVAVIVLGVVLFVRVIKARQMHIALRRLGGIALLVVMVSAVVMLFLPTQSSYFISRLRSTQTSGGLAAESSFAARKSFITSTYEHTAQTDSLIGVGFASPAQDSQLTAVDRWSADTLWVPVVYRLGLVGVVLFVVLFFVYMARALVTTLLSSGDVEFLALVWLGVIAGTMVGTFVSWSVVNPNRMPMGLWPLAFLAVLPLATISRGHGGQEQ